ncbi:copper-binding protein [Brenneria izbisi]|uniref:Copper-binding protein n=1 Tax=Brenneria izbisi TaxID=2939450 RepID=A0AA41XZS2_9GAMM|nr:copper-binding protein [Brenneria izbisi]MCV9877977.1 copper-binding protein [Brenneria izbisi]MCV9881459.1 copper-binding protein [Brenneria izbisi]
MRAIYVALTSVLLFSSSPLWANEHQHHAMMPPDMASTVTTTVHQATGTVKQWNADSVTIAHNPVATLRWPAMTMAFKLPSGSTFIALAANTPVAFSFEQQNSGYVLTSITPQQK